MATGILQFHPRFIELGRGGPESTGQLYKAGLSYTLTGRYGEKGQLCNRCREALYECTCPLLTAEEIGKLNAA